MQDAGVSITFRGPDTARQEATSLQENATLVCEVFDRVPENVQLPLVLWHYNITAGLDANQQAVLSFRNGDPLLAQYSPGRGRLYICATSAGLDGGNFAGSYFFVPFLYQMAAQSRSASVYALQAGSQLPIHLPGTQSGDQSMVHITAPGIDVIPPQRNADNGTDVFAGEVISNPGFYRAGLENADSIVLALNASRSESLPEVWTPEQLATNWKSAGADFTGYADASRIAGNTANAAFPLWKVCLILALILLAAETFVLVRPTAAKAEPIAT